MMGHLAAADFMDSLEGVELASRKAAHLKRCQRCQESFRAINPYFEIVSEPVPPDLGVVRLDSDALRSGVRDQLLARAVKKSSFLNRWTGHTLTPATAWGLGLALIVSALAGGFWHYQTDLHSSTSAVSSTSALAEADLELALFDDDSAALETEALAWSETELFIALNELEESEEDALLDLIALTFEDDNGV